MRLKREDKRKIRAAVNKTIAAQVRTLGLTDALYEFGTTSDEIVAYAEQWRGRIADELMLRGSKSEEPTEV